MPLGSYLLSWVSALEHSNSMILLSVLEIVSIVLLSVCLDLGSLIIGLYVGLRISSAAEVLGHTQQICIRLISWAQPSGHFQWLDFSVGCSSAVT